MNRKPNRALLMILVAAVIMAPRSRAQKTFDLPIYCKPVEQVVATENLKTVASKTTDLDVWLGLAYLARVGSPARQEISQMAVKAKPEYRPVVAVLSVMMDGADDRSVSELLTRDPDNALGHYLRGNLLYHSGQEAEGIESFRRAAACSELRLYEGITSEALLKALDALGLKGRERLGALSWMATRESNFHITYLQSLSRTLSEFARKAGAQARKEISDLLLILAGHLRATNFDNRSFAERALRSAFRLKAEIAADEKSPTMNGYAAVVQALVSVDLAQFESRQASDAVKFLPSRIWSAFAMVEQSVPYQQELLEKRANLPEPDRAGFDQAKENAVQAAQALINVTLSDPDGIVGTYLKGYSPASPNAPGPWVTRLTYVERLIEERPDIVKIALANEQARDALHSAGSNDPWRRNMSRLMQVGLALYLYAVDHDHTYPDSFQSLSKKHLKPPLEPKSVLTGKPYTYVAGGHKMPDKSRELEFFILCYDENSTAEGLYQCVMADGHGESLPADKLKEQLRKQAK